MKCQNCGSISQVRDLYDGLCFTCAWPNNVTTPKPATAIGEEMARVTIASVFERLHEHLEQDMYRRMALPAHLFGGGRVRLPTGPLTFIDDTPEDRHVEAVKYAINWHATKHTEPKFLGPCECGRPIYGTAMDRGRKCEVCHETAPKPPTLREWLGPENVAKLGEWGGVLREQPVPAAEVREWKWSKYGASWVLEFQTDTMRGGLSRAAVIDAARGDADPWDPSLDALQPGLFTRHPAVLPEPAPLRTWFGNEEEL